MWLGKTRWGLLYENTEFVKYNLCRIRLSSALLLIDISCGAGDRSWSGSEHPERTWLTLESSKYRGELNVVA